MNNEASLVHKIQSIVERIDVAALFPKQQPLEVELGSGDGSFIIQYTKSHPEHNFIGVERLLGRLRKIDKKGRRHGLTNLRAVRIEASYFLEYLLPQKSIVALHVYFPDPWPKRKHKRRRLINEHFTELAKRALQPGGEVFLRTDDADYFSQMTEVFDANAAFEKFETPQSLREVITDFERGFHAQGISTRAAAYRLKN